MFVIFFIPLILVALFEAHLDTRRNIFMRHMFSATQDGEDEDPNNRDPQVSDENGLVISKKSFDEIVKAFPNSFLVSLIPRISFLRLTNSWIYSPARPRLCRNYNLWGTVWRSCSSNWRTRKPKRQLPNQRNTRTNIGVPNTWSKRVLWMAVFNIDLVMNLLWFSPRCMSLMNLRFLLSLSVVFSYTRLVFLHSVYLHTA
jgi:hypothetical protein